VNGNERADVEAKKAAKGDSSQASELPALLTADPLPRSVTAARQCFRPSLQNLWRIKWMVSPRYARMAAIDDALPAKSFYKGIAGFTRAQTSLTMQLRTTHVPLNKHLYRIKKAQSPFCPACTGAEESVHHYLFECRAHEHARVGLRRRLGQRSKSMKELLGSHKAMVATLAYVATTKRLQAVVGDVTPHPA
jgi:hypothetical protein